MTARRLPPLLVFLLAGCGGGDAADPGDGPAPPPAVAETAEAQEPVDGEARVTAELALPRVEHVDPPYRGPEPLLVLNVTPDGRMLVDRLDKAFGNERLLEALRWEEGARLETVTLAEWRTILELGRRQWREPETGHSLVRVRLRLDRDVPLRWLRMVMTVCAEGRTGRLELAVDGPGGSEGRLAVPLPADRGRGGERLAEPAAAGDDSDAGAHGASVQLVWVDDDEQARRTVASTVDVTWEAGTDDGWTSARDRIQELVRERGPAAEARIGGPPGWPVGRTARVLSILRERGTGRIAIRASVIPTPEQRQAGRLPPVG